MNRIMNRIMIRIMTRIMSKVMNVLEQASIATMLICSVGVCVLGGCALPYREPNPSFPLTHAEAESDLRRMAESPVALERPVIVVSGIGDPAVSSAAIVRAIGPTTVGTVIEVDFFDELTFPGARQKLLRETALHLGVSIDALPEVDVVAFSMGGLVARDAAIIDAAGRRLPIRRLFTICTPHEGARLAGIPLGTPQSEDMKTTSDFIQRLRTARRKYDLCCYTRLDDITVGEEFAAPEGTALWWLPTPSGQWAHMQAFDDPRIMADIARRLRGEAPFSTLPAAPLPN